MSIGDVREGGVGAGEWRGVLVAYIINQYSDWKLQGVLISLKLKFYLFFLMHSYGYMLTLEEVFIYLYLNNKLSEKMYEKFNERKRWYWFDCNCIDQPIKTIILFTKILTVICRG